LTNSQGATKLYFWGYGIQKEIKRDMDPQKFNRIAKSKLLLDQSEHTEETRDSLAPILKRLKRKGINKIKENEDVIAHYLTELFKHTKKRLQISREYVEGEPIEHVLCVPASWSQDACRKMQKAMNIATKNAQFGNADDLFLVSEPEASAAFVIGKGRQVFVSVLYIWVT
jgi:molecular chaperone DnaK (HSP70)